MRWRAYKARGRWISDRTGFPWAEEEVTSAALQDEQFSINNKFNNTALRLDGQLPDRAQRCGVSEVCPALVALLHAGGSGG